MKHKLSYFLTKHDNQIDDLANMYSYEYIERLFQIEFACGIENSAPLFLSDLDGGLLEKYDGKVIDYIFRNATGEIFDTTQTACRFDIMYDDENVSSVHDEISNAKITRRGIKH